MIWIIAILTLLAGTLLPVQAGINSKLGVMVWHPVRAAFISFLVGLVFLLLYVIFIRKPWPTPSEIKRFPWWIWTGGILGAVYVIASILFAPKLGAAVFISLVVTGQMVASILLDHYGLVGFSIRTVTPLRILGVFLLIGGVILIRLF